MTSGSVPARPASDLPGTASYTPIVSVSFYSIVHASFESRERLAFYNMGRAHSKALDERHE